MNNSKLNLRNRFIRPLHPLSICLKLSVIILVAVLTDSTPSQPTWAVILGLFAALFLVPVAFQQIRKHQSVFRMDADGLVWHLPCALLLAISFLLDRGNLAGIFALPYATWCVETLLRGFRIDGKMVYLVTLTAFLFLSIGAIWLVFDRFNIRPLEFPTWIVILTGVHFHFAGFTLLTAVMLFLFQNPFDRKIKLVSFAIIIGVFLTAIGIIATQLGYSDLYETLSGVWMSVSAVSAAAIFIKNSLGEQKITKILWFSAGICLISAMIFAFLYALRTLFPLDTLTLPFMQTVHGTLNALGFGTLVLLGWALKKDTTV